MAEQTNLPEPAIESCIVALVRALQAEKAWLHDYADSIVRDAIERRHLVEKAPAAPSAELAASEVAAPFGYVLHWPAGGGGTKELFDRSRLAGDAIGCKVTPVFDSPAAEGAPFGIIDPDYARYYTLIRTTAWQCGYAIGLHGSFTRDLDLIAAPWTAQAMPPGLLIKQIEYRTDLKRQEPEGREKPHGRLCWSLLLPGFTDPRWIDFSVMPTLAALDASRLALKEETK